jgi:hypothetical protein
VRLHVTNGDAAVPGLRGMGLVEPIMPWRDALHEGPVPDVPDEELRRLRARRGRSSATVLEGRADHVSLNGIDRWIGGVHLTGTEVPWRWDEGTETITDRRASAR